MKLRNLVRLPSYRLRRAGGSMLLLALVLPAAAQQEFGQGPAAGAYANAPGVQSGAFAPDAGNFPPTAAQPGLPPAPPGQSGFAPPPGNSDVALLQALLQQERQDYGVPPQQQLQTNLHGPTPSSIPGGQVITTDRLLALYQQAGQNGLLVFHVLGPGPTLPYAQNAAPASQAGSFDDQTQQQFGQYLQQVTQGNRSRPLVFYCQSTQCWMSYNASLRAIRLGFSQVYWYRGGIEAWQQMQQLSARMVPPNAPMPSRLPGNLLPVNPPPRAGSGY